MVGPAALLLFAVAGHHAQRCTSVTQTAQTMIAARQQGMSEETAIHTVDDALEGDARTTARVLVWYVYEANSDNRTSPAKVLELIRNACVSSDTNALSERAP